MNYQVLATKWRPQLFTDVIGQKNITMALSNSLDMKRIHNAYLFSGTRGIGKTTIARLLAKGLNCKNDITSNPCRKCDNCIDIEQGRFIDLIEIDAASKTRVEDTRELLDNIQYSATIGRFKVYLIDEIHMLSKHSFNALLKTLEEPPEHVKFIFATTDPEKLPITILSRCLHFHLKCINSNEIEKKLQFILKKEKIPAEVNAIKLISDSANGSMRDALSLTDQAIAIGNGQINQKTINLMLGDLDDKYPLKIIEALIDKNAENIMIIINDIDIKYIDWDKFLVKILHILHRIAMLQFLPENINHNKTFGELNISINNKIINIANNVSPTDIQLYYQIILMGRKDLTISPNFRIGVEMTLLRALAFYPNNSITSNFDPEQNLFIPNKLKLSSDDYKKKSLKDNLSSDKINVLQKITELSQNKIITKKKNNISKNKILILSNKNINKKDFLFFTKLKIIVQKQDDWAAEISKFNLPRLTEKLALNSWKEHIKQNIYIHLRSKFSYLNTTLNNNILKKAFNKSKYYNNKLIIIEDDNFIKLTPMELQKKIYLEHKLKVYQSFSKDIYVQKLCNIFNTKLDKNNLDFI